MRLLWKTSLRPFWHQEHRRCPRRARSRFPKDSVLTKPRNRTSFRLNRSLRIGFSRWCSRRPAQRRTAEVRKPVTAKSEPRRRSVTQQQNDLQPELDFLVPPPQGPRTLKTHVEAVIYCDASVASPKHRAIASALDGGMIFIGFGAFLFTFHLMGGMFHLNRQTIPFFIGVFGTLALFYSLLWIWSGRETLGMRWTKLRLIDFDGLPAARRDRVLRIVGACLSCCAGWRRPALGIGGRREVDLARPHFQDLPDTARIQQPFFPPAVTPEESAI